MLSSIGKSIVAGAVLAIGAGFGAREAAADSFSVSVHTPTVSAGYSNHNGRVQGGYVGVYAPPAPVAYCPPAPVVVRPAPWATAVAPTRVVVVYPPRHECTYDRVPVQRVRYDDCGRRVYYTEWVRVRTCDDYHRNYGRGYGYGYGHDRYDDHHGHGNGHDKHGHGGHDRDWHDDDRHDHHDDHRGRH